MSSWSYVLWAALWAAGTGVLIAVWFRFGYERWKERKRVVLLLGEARGQRLERLREVPFIRALAEDMQIAEMKLPIEILFGVMLFFGVIGWFGVEQSVMGLQQRYALDADKVLSVNTWLLNGSVSVLLGSLPYFYVKFRLQQKRHRIALDMIKLVQNIIGHYHANRTVQEMIARSSGTMPDHVRSEWRLLEISSHLSASLEEALYDFARRVDNEWAEDMADILLIKHKYGNDVIDALHKLVVDIQTARRNEERRLAMVTVYRIGTLVMGCFAIFIVLFNIYADGANYRHYFVNPSGKMLLLFSAVVFFVSLVLVVRSGRRTF